ncbi:MULTISPECIES: glycosyltransferase family 39 protein [unclassified Nitrospina]|uniref:glycosyltransferase family 39 protein n=1 Tax=unclassified Nitrospina TaxID=2638683 RepID=UPI003F9BC062
MTQRLQFWYTGGLPIGSVLIAWMLISWQRWPDLLVDFGQQAYVPWALSQGHVLYRDIAYFHGPLSSYIHTLVFLIFGPGILQLALFNLALVSLVSFLIFRLCHYFSNRLNATLICLSFITVFVFAHHMGFGSFNFIAPYTYDLTHGILLGIFTLFLFYRYLKSPRLQTLCGLGVLLGLVFLTKVEVFLAVSLSLGGGLFIFWSQRRLHSKIILLNAAVFAGCSLLPILAFALYFSFFMPVTRAFSHILGQYLNASDPVIRTMPYYQFTLGWMHLEDNLKRMGLHALVFICLGGLVSYLNHIFSRNGTNHKWTGLLFGLLTLAALWALTDTIPWLEISRAFPIILFITGFYLAIRIGREQRLIQITRRRIIFLTLIVFSLTLTFKAFYNLRLTDLGFALAMPATLVILFFALHSLPRMAERISGDSAIIRSVSITAVLYFIAVIGMNSLFAYQNKTYPVGEGVDRIFDFQPLVQYPDGRIFSRGLIVNETLELLKKELGEETDLLTLPDAMIFNYLLRKPFPTRDTLFSPLTMRTQDGNKVLARLQSAQPSHILLVHADYQWFGQRHFGTDYARSVMEWIQRDYLLIRQIGATPFEGREFGVRILKRLPPKKS